MDMKKADGGIDDEAGRKMFAYTFEKVDDILANNIINKKHCLIRMDVSVF